MVVSPARSVISRFVGLPGGAGGAAGMPCTDFPMCYPSLSQEQFLVRDAHGGRQPSVLVCASSLYKC